MEVKEYEELVGELELRVDRLRALFDQYFMGIEKTTPNVQHKDVERRIAMLRREQVRNTALRFRFQMLIQRYNTYQTYWQRICRQIEEGTYKRHVQRAKAKAEQREQQLRKDSGSFEIDVTELAQTDEMPGLDLVLPEREEEEKDTVFFEPPNSVPPFPRSQPPAELMPPAPISRPIPRQEELVPPAPISRPPIPRQEEPAQVPRVAAPAGRVWKKVEKPAAPPPALAPPPPAPPLVTKPAPQPPKPEPAPQPQPRPPQQPPPVRRPLGMPLARPDAIPEPRMRELYAKYVEAKRSRKESTAGLTYESLAQTLRESGEKLRQKHGKSVDFEVSEKDGKTILKPVLK